jgi:hypothetical protein
MTLRCAPTARDRAAVIADSLQESGFHTVLTSWERSGSQGTPIYDEGAHMDVHAGIAIYGGTLDSANPWWVASLYVPREGAIRILGANKADVPIMRQHLRKLGLSTVGP